MIEDLKAEVRVALDDIGRRVGIALAVGLTTIVGLGFAAAALWTVAASAWGAALASGVFAATLLAASATIFVGHRIATRSAAREAELARTRRAARANGLLAAFRLGADIGSRLPRTKETRSPSPR